MTDDTRRLIAAAKADPTDDAPREALADHLAATGDPERAEFVRHQLRNTEVTEWYVGEPEARAREDVLRKKNQRAWTGNGYGGTYWFDYADAQRDYLWDDGGTPDVARGKFERGFFRVDGSVPQCRTAFDRLTAEQAAWLERLAIDDVTSAAELMSSIDSPRGREATAVEISLADDASPAALDPLDRDTLREIGGDPCAVAACQRRMAAFRELKPHKMNVAADEDDPDALAELMAAPVMANVRDLEFSVDAAAEVVTALAESDCRPTRLFLCGDGFSPKQLRALFDSPVVRDLRSLSVSGYSGNVNGVVAELAKSTILRGLVELDLGFNRVTAAEMRALAAWPGLEGVRVLNFSSGEVSDAGIVALAGSSLAASLEELELFGEKLTDEAVVAIARSPHLRNLKRLSLCKVGLTGRGLRAVAASETLSGLVDLDISLTPLPADALGVLAASTTLGGLKRLGLRGLKPNNEAFAALMKSPVLAGVETLDLQAAQLNGPKLAALIESPRLRSLRELTLGENGLPPTAIDAVLSAGWLHQLLALTVYRNGVSDVGVKALAANLSGSALASLDLNDNDLTDAAADTLLAWPGLRQLTDLSLYPNPAMTAARMNEVARASWEG